MKNVKPPTQTVEHRPSVLAIHHGAGVSKKSKRARNQSSKARKRAEEAQDRALAIAERTEHKVAKSKGSARNIQGRRKTWDEINRQIPAGDGKMPGEEDEEEVEEVSDFDDEMGDEATTNTNLAAAVSAPSVPVPPIVDDDEIL